MDKARAATAEVAKGHEGPMLHIAVRTVLHVPIEPGNADGHTFGQIIDGQLEEAAMRGDTVEGFELEIPTGVWSDFRNQVNGTA